MSLEYSIPIPNTSEHLDLQVGPLGSRKLTYHGRKLGSGLSARINIEAEGRRFNVTTRTYFADALPRIVIDKEAVQYFESLPVGMQIIGVLTKIAMILGVVNGFIFFIPGLLAFYLQQYLYRKMDDKSTAVIVALVLMILSWLIVVWGFFFWYNLITGR